MTYDVPWSPVEVPGKSKWSGNWEWKLDYSNPERVSPEEIARLKAENDKAKDTAKALRVKLPASA